MNANLQLFLEAIETLRDELKSSSLERELIKLENSLQTDNDLPWFVTQAITLVRQEPAARKRLKELIEAARALTGSKGYTELLGHSTATIKLGPLMICSRDSNHPRRKLHRTGQRCRECGAKLVRANQRLGSSGGSS